MQLHYHPGYKQTHIYW